MYWQLTVYTFKMTEEISDVNGAPEQHLSAMCHAVLGVDRNAYYKAPGDTVRPALVDCT